MMIYIFIFLCGCLICSWSCLSFIGIVLPSSNKPTVTMVKMVPSSAPVVPQSSSCKSVLQQKLELKLHQLKQLQTELTEQVCQVCLIYKLN